MCDECDVILLVFYGVFWSLKNFLTVGPNGTCSVFEIDGLRFSLVVPFLNVFHLWPVFPVGGVRFKIGKKVDTDPCFFVDYNFLPTKPLGNGDFFRCLAWAYLNWLTLGFSTCFQSREDGSHVMKRVRVWEDYVMILVQARREAITVLRQELEKTALAATTPPAASVAKGLEEQTFAKHEVANVKVLLLQHGTPTTTESGASTGSCLSAPLLDASLASVDHHASTFAAATNDSPHLEEEMLVVITKPPDSDVAPSDANQTQSELSMKHDSETPPAYTSTVVASAPPPTQSLLFSDI